MLKKLLLLLLIPVVSLAQTGIPDRAKAVGYIYQSSTLLSPADVASLDQDLYDMDAIDSVQMAVVIVDHIPANTSIEDYALSIGRTWGIGKYGNGVVYVLALKDNLQRLEIAGHLESIVPDIDAKEIEETAKAFYRHGQWLVGMKSAVARIRVLIKTHKMDTFAPPIPVTKQEPESWGWSIALVGFFIGIVFLMTKLIHRRKKHESEKTDDDYRRDHSLYPYYMNGPGGSNYNRSMGHEQDVRSVYVAPVIESPSYTSTPDPTPSYDPGPSFDSSPNTDFGGGGATDSLT